MGDRQDSLYPVAVLIDELKNEDIQLRLNSIRRLSTIAVALGAERTRNELVPFLNESIDDEDDVLLALADELGGFAEYVGGPPHAATLLTPLETLATVEETVVREKAVESLTKVAAQLSDPHLLEHFVPLIRRLAQGDWFTSRISACGLFAVGYGRMPLAVKGEMRASFGQLCRDDTPMVRRAAASHLGKLAAAMYECDEADHFKADLLPLFASLSADEQDSVRLLAVDNCVRVGALLSTAEHQASVLPIIRAVSADKSWRVRYVVAELFCALCERVGDDITVAEMLPTFVSLLQDTEAEVRTAAAFKATGFAEMLPPEQVLGHLMPCVAELCADGSQHVRAALAAVIMGLSRVLGRSATVEHLLPRFLDLLKDEFPEVRLNIIASLGAVSEVIGVEELSQSLLPAIAELAADRQWRVRLAIIECIPLLAAQLGVRFFEEQLCAMCIDWLHDCVYTIRESAIVNLKQIVEAFGVEWAASTLLPAVLDATAAHPNFLHRMTLLSAVASLAPIVGRDVLTATLLPVVLNMQRDSVPNIRFNVAKTLQALVGELAPDVVASSVKPCLLALCDDADKDVRYYATQALQSC
mmetsp:Transcript_45033/g.133086  ORF Transcript_45033/g.133086 Transcript_45033/m.133086 type:complete len:586 (-) Transcript_45033:284-2041(-)